jgi:hypothetical protein
MHVGGETIGKARAAFFALLRIVYAVASTSSKKPQKKGKRVVDKGGQALFDSYDGNYRQLPRRRYRTTWRWHTLGWHKIELKALPLQVT